MQLVVYPDAEAEVLTYLRSALSGRTEPYLSGLLLGTRKPAQFTMPFVAVRRAGGISDAVVVDHPRVDVQVWHADDERAHDLAQLCRALLLAMTGMGGVIRARDFTGPIPIPDPETDTPRYLFTVELAMRGQVTT